jgi:hypothetical protein
LEKPDDCDQPDHTKLSRGVAGVNRRRRSAAPATAPASWGGKKAGKTRKTAPDRQKLAAMARKIALSEVEDATSAGRSVVKVA